VNVFSILARLPDTTPNITPYRAPRGCFWAALWLPLGL